jgi:hypothetical protein
MIQQDRYSSEKQKNMKPETGNAECVARLRTLVSAVVDTKNKTTETGLSRQFGA